jgi:hypothetical protein
MDTNIGVVWEQFYNDNSKAMISLPIVQLFSCSVLSLKCNGREFVCHVETSVRSAAAWPSSSPDRLHHALLPCIVTLILFLQHFVCLVSLLFLPTPQDDAFSMFAFHTSSSVLQRTLVAPVGGPFLHCPLYRSPSPHSSCMLGWLPSFQGTGRHVSSVGCNPLWAVAISPRNQPYLSYNRVCSYILSGPFFMENYSHAERIKCPKLQYVTVTFFLPNLMCNLRFDILTAGAVNSSVF